MAQRRDTVRDILDFAAWPQKPPEAFMAVATSLHKTAFKAIKDGVRFQNWMKAAEEAFISAANELADRGRK